MCSTRFTSIDIELSVQLFTVGCFTLSLPSKESSWRAMLLAYKIQQFDNFLQHKNFIRTSTRHNEMCNIYARNGIEITAVVSSVIILLRFSNIHLSHVTGSLVRLCLFMFLMCVHDDVQVNYFSIKVV